MTPRTEAAELALRMLDGPAIPWRWRYAALRPCSAPLDVSGTVTAAVAQFQANTAILGANGGLDAHASHVMLTM
jgi:hypothetical protein